MYINESINEYMKINRKAIILISFCALIVQLIIISFNHLNGYILIPNPAIFFIKVLNGWFFTSIFAIAVVYIDVYFINYFEKHYQWVDKFFKRTGLNLLLIIISGSLTGYCGTMLINFIFPYKQPLMRVIINNMMIIIVLNIIIVIILEALLFFIKSREAGIKAESLLKENALMKLDIVKNQLNPHFLFNSLNTLSALIEKDHQKSQDFINEFSSVYRYILDVLDKDVVDIQEELNFTKSYFYLQKIRFSELIELNISIEPKILEYIIPPLTLQILVENAIKHNKISKEKKLEIFIKNENEYLIIKNNLVPKLSGVVSKGVGLSNLKKRYEHIFGITPVFLITENEYIAKLPLIEPQ
jgi:two-component system, LytTR family, sensor kinase